MQKFQFFYGQVFVMNFSYYSGWHYISPNFTSHKIHGHKHSSQLIETRIDYKKSASTHPNILIKWGGGGKGRLIISAIKILFKIHKMCGILT